MDIGVSGMRKRKKKKGSCIEGTLVGCFDSAENDALDRQFKTRHMVERSSVK